MWYAASASLAGAAELQMRFDRLKRREFMTLLGGAAAWPLAARAQRPSKVPLLGYLTGDSESVDSPRRKAFREGLHDLGYDEGRNVLIEHRTTAGSVEKLSNSATELSRLNVDVMFAFTAGAVNAAVRAMPAKPIVSITPDPVSAGLVASLARPGGNITGLSTLAGTEIYGKYLEFLKDGVPDLVRVAVLSNPNFTIGALAFKVIEATAPTLGLTVQLVEARNPTQLEAAVVAAITEGAAGLVVVQDPMFLAQRVQLAELTAKNRLPAIYGIKEHAEAGGLMAYAASRPELFRRAAAFVVKILRGANPADLPVEQPTKFELVINLKTAKALGLNVPPTLLALADEVIE
jgi:putative tryptophan/tyrosine transport system substrate-binding protein